MRKILIPALGFVLVLALAPVARAGKAHSGQVTPGKSTVLSKAALKLVGTWQMVAFEFAGKRRPFPGNKAFTVTLHSDGTLSTKNLPQAKTLNKSRWNIKGKHVVLTHKKKVQKLGYSVKANELLVSMPGNTKYRIILHRVTKKTKP